MAYAPGEGGAWAAVALDGGELARVERDEVGREVARSAGAVRQTQEYDPQGRLARQAGVGARGTAVFGRRYGYDAADQITRLDDEARGVRTYQYDACERLLAVGGSAPERFVVDPAGNLLARDGASEGDAAPGDRLARYRDGAEERAFTYDAWGNRVGERRAAKGHAPVEVAYAYDADDTLREVRTTDRAGARATTRVTRFGYDALGRRVWKAAARLTVAAALAVAGGGTPSDAQPAPEPPEAAWVRTAFVWSGDVLAAESDRPADDPCATAYVYEPGAFTPLALARGEGATGAIYRYHVDYLGTPQELSDAAGQVAWRAQYRAWGAVTRAEGERVAQPLRFPGQYADAETGLHYNRHRYYSPAEGRFTTQDPIRLIGGDNLAAYAPNAAVWIDPLGLAGFKTVDFTGHQDLFPVSGNQQNVVQITMQGSRGRDFTEAYRVSGIPRSSAEGTYTWHHVADFDPATGKTTMQLVKTTTHEASLPHQGSVKQFEQEFGVKYGKPAAIAKADEKGWVNGRAPSCAI